MSFQNLYIEKIEIERFKKIRSMTLEPERAANLFFGSYRSGKTSLCEFIQFVLYGGESVSLARDNAEDALGRIRFLADGKGYQVERSIIKGVEDVSFVDLESGALLSLTTTPGEFLTGLDSDSFDQISYFRQARYETPVFKPKFSFLRKIASDREETAELYREESEKREIRDYYRNADENGTLDLASKEQAKLKEKLEEIPRMEEEARQVGATLAEIALKVDENERRVVLLKADMAGHADDLQLSRNKENAEDLNKKIQAKEKKYRIQAYEVANKVGKLSPEELANLKGDYNRLSLADTALAEARLALTAAEDNLAFHMDLFAGEESEEYYTEEKRRIDKSKVGRLVFRLIAALLCVLGVSLGVALYTVKQGLMISLAAGGALLLLAVALLSVSTVFTGLIRKVLERTGKESLEEFNEFYDRIIAHAKTTQVYRDQLAREEKKTEKCRIEKDAAQTVIANKVFNLGYDEEDGELLAICDEIIEANDSLLDLEEEIEEDKEEYRRLIATDVNREELTVSNEFAAMQKELSFLTVQNDSLFKKKALMSARLEEIRLALKENPEELAAELTELNEKVEGLEKDYQEALEAYRDAKVRRIAFEANLRDELANRINQKLSFFLREEESFLFDEDFVLCYRDQRSVIPLAHAGGGLVTELGLFAFRLSLAELLKQNGLFMIFDDSFATMDPKTAESVYRLLSDTCSQFLIASSSEFILNLCQNTAKVFTI